MAERIAEREDSLRQAVKEREVLLREVHHRVKNNLQIITSLLNIQMSDQDSDAVAEKLLEAKTRIRALGILHDQLYRKSDLSSIDLKRLFQDLCKHFWQIYGVDTGRVGYQVRMSSMIVDIDKAIPLSLLGAEALTNALKYAFPGERVGVVTIDAKLGDELYSISVMDNGVGMNPSQLKLAATARSLGMRLMRSLADQLDGTLEMSSEGGTEVRLSVPIGSLKEEANGAETGS